MFRSFFATGRAFSRPASGPSSIEAIPSYYECSHENWRCLRTNKPMERLMREIRRRTRVIKAYPGGRSALMMMAARLHYAAASRWETGRYLNMKRLAQVAVA
jgi:transposase-like protein